MTIQVFYDPRQSTPDNHSRSPSAGKPALCVAEWLRLGYAEVISFDPVDRVDFYRVHAARHVDAVLDCRKDNGFDNRLPQVAATLPWTTGSLVAAACRAWATRKNTCSPTSGFHHACFASCGGFCTFNGLMVATALIMDIDPVPKVGILDLDQHFGNGTEDIIEKCGYDGVMHYTFGGCERGSWQWRGNGNAERWLQDLPGIVAGFKHCDVVLYQAGADPHVDDPFGGALSSAQLRRRDRIVFQGFKALGIPVAWNLAGGYQEPVEKVVNIHTATMEECLETL